MRIRSSIVLTVTLFAAALFVACGSPTTSNTGTGSKSGQRGGTLSYRMTAAPTTFNYLKANDEPTVQLASFLLTSRLIDFDHKEQKYVPGLAESWKLGDDGKTVDVKLRDGLKFSDGSDLTADDVVFTLNAIYDERTNSAVWKSAMLVNDKQITAKAVDKLNIQFVFPEKIARPENYLNNLGVLPAKALKPDLDAGKLAESWKIDSDPTKIVTSGPFVVESVNVGEKVTLARNPNYWKKDAGGTQLPYLDKLVIDVITDPNNTVARLQQDQLDIADRIRPGDYATLNVPNAAVKPVDVGPGMSTDHIWFNLNDRTADGRDLSKTPKHEWFADKRFRKAIASAIDRETISNTTLRGLASPMNSFVSPANKAWLDPNAPKIEYGVGKASAMLADAGFVKKGTPEAPELYDAKGNRVEFTLIVPVENEPRKLAAGVIQQDLAKLGINMQIAPIENSAAVERWSRSFDYDAVLLGLAISDLEPSSYAAFLLSSGSQHQWQPSQKEPATDWEKQIDQLFAEQATESDTQKRHEEFDRIQQIMSDEMPVIPVVTRHVVSAASAKVGNFSPSQIMPYSLWNIDRAYVTK